MSCEKLYLTAPEMLECTARVVSCTPSKNGGYDLETDRTPFFPEGGGQLSDIGTVYDPTQGLVPVTHCFEANGTVLHRTEKPFAVGEIVTLKVDAAKRLKYTQQHTGEHLLSHAYDVLFGAENVGFHMAKDVVTIDLDHDLSDEEIEAGEKYANELVWKNAPVRIFSVDASELPNLPLRKKNEKLHGEVRIVEVEDGGHTEMCTCCGTHFMSTAPVGLIKVLEHVRYKSGCRITFACGVLALEHFTKENTELRRTAAALSVKPDGVFDALARKEEQVQGLNQKLREKNAQLAKLYGEKLHAEAQENFIAAYLPVDFDACKTIAETLCADDNFSAVLFCNESDRLRYICARGKNGALDCRAAAQKINALLGAKGGGSPMTSQGSCPKTTEAEQKLCEILSEPVQNLN